jgi:hypothetical protein
MTNTSNRISALCALLVAFAATPAAAEPPGAPPGKPDKATKAAEKAEAKEARADEKPGKSEKHAADADERAEKKAAKADEKAAKADEKADKAHDRGEPGRGVGPDGAGPPGHARGARGFRALGAEFAAGSITKAELKERIATMQKNRSERRHDHRVDLKTRWGATLANPACREELRHHARREAFLARALFVTQTEVTTKDKDKLVERIQKLVAKENDRHAKAMERLKSAPATAPAAAPAETAAPANAPAKEGGQ